MKRIICTGNRLLVEDSFGPKVFDYLNDIEVPSDVEVIDGGLAGLDLLSYLEGSNKLIFVDSVSEFDRKGEVVIFDLENLLQQTTCQQYSHTNGLIFLLHHISAISTYQIPPTFLVGFDGYVNDKIIKTAAEICIEMVA